jgi:branched-subunit amino acid aminotransferase/4-amino-4-deoxychorismate lyase
VTSLRPDDLAGFQEAFFLSTTKDVTPIACIDANCFRVGPETLTSRLMSALGDFARGYAAAHAEYRVG